MKLFLLGLYTARIELFKFFYVFVSGVLAWSVFLYYKYSGSLTKRKKRRRALIVMIVSGVVLFAMSISWILSKTNYGWWFDRF
jgi:hypothetical protein